MSQLSRTALRSLRAPRSAVVAAIPHTARAAGRIPCAHYQTRWASTEKGSGGKDTLFKRQMLESISQRMAREKAELREAAIEREAKGKGRNFAQTFGELPYCVLML